MEVLECQQNLGCVKPGSIKEKIRVVKEISGLCKNNNTSLFRLLKNEYNVFFMPLSKYVAIAPSNPAIGSTMPLTYEIVMHFGMLNENVFEQTKPV